MSVSESQRPSGRRGHRPGDDPVFRAHHVLIASIVLALLALSAQRLHLADMFAPLFDESGSQAGDISSSEEAGPWFRLSEETVVDAETDAADLPLFAYLEQRVVKETRLNSETLAMESLEIVQTVKVEPLGYLGFVLVKMLETVEIAIWASLLAVIVSTPLAWLGAQNYTPHPVVYVAVRSLVAFCRAVPELISALLLVLVFGFGAVVGVLAMALHSIGFLGKFFAEEIETADPHPQDALRATGAGELSVLRLAVIPGILPNLCGLMLYILDRNIRMATVVGLVGAGGIGQELKGRYDLFQYDRVATILLVIFLTVLAVDQISARLRHRLV